MPTIHPTALVDSHAELAADVTVGPYAIVGPHVRVGSGTTIGPHAVIDGWTTIGARCRIFTGAVFGTISQDLKFKGQQSYLTIGDDNIIREYVTINRGTQERSTTRIGHGNLMMAYAHVAHDCVIGDRCIVANAGTLAGYVTLEDQAIVGGLAAVHQFARVGRLAIIGGCSKVVQDVVPFAVCDGHPARIHGINVVGLRRAGIAPAVRTELEQAFRQLFRRGLATGHALAELERQEHPSAELQHLLTFIRGSKRGLCRGAVRAAQEQEVEAGDA